MDENEPDIFYRIISQKTDSQIRLTINEFRGVEYLSLREYYLDFDEEWKPTPKGITVPLSIPVTQELFKGLVEILSLAESKSILEDHFKEIIDVLYNV